MKTKPPQAYIACLPEALASLIPKYCAQCEATKPRKAFNRNRSTLDGLQYTCRTCQRDIQAGNRIRKANRKSSKPELVKVKCPMCLQVWESKSLFLRTCPKCKSDRYCESDYPGGGYSLGVG